MIIIHNFVHHNFYYNCNAIYNHNFLLRNKLFSELLQYRYSHHQNDTREMALQSYRQINVQNEIDIKIYKKVRIWGRADLFENAVKGV